MSDHTIITPPPPHEGGAAGFGFVADGLGIDPQPVDDFIEVDPAVAAEEATPTPTGPVLGETDPKYTSEPKQEGERWQKNASDKLQSGFEQIGEGLKEAFDGIRNEPELRRILNDLKDSLNKAGDEIKDFLDGKKDNEPPKSE